LVQIQNRFNEQERQEKKERLGLDFGEHGEHADYAVATEADSDVDTFRKEFKGQLAQLNGHKN